MSIPKVIHYCWLSNDPLPAKLAHCVETWKQKCPDYEIINWNFERLGDDCPIWVKQAFQTKKYAFAADWIRAYVLYSYGGIYLDSDVEVLKNFDNLLDNKYILSYEADSTETIETAVMGAEKGLNFFHDLLAYYDNREFIKEDGTLDTFPLPHIINQITKNKYTIIPIQNPEVLRSHKYESNNLLILPPDYFSPKSLETGKINLTNNSYTIHHFAATWTTKSHKRKRALRQKYPKIMRFIVICKHILNGTRPI